jgi:hypothetical protein
MKKISAKIVISALFILALFSLSFAQNEERITITTYYPSPFGSYRELRAQRMAIGGTYFDGAQFGWPDQNPPPANLIGQNADLVVEGNVGIGTTNPGASLTIQGPGNAPIAPALLDITDNVQTPILFVRGDGNVGIGTNTPTQALDIVSNAAAFRGIRVENQGNPLASAGIQFVNNVGNGAAIFQTSSQPLGSSLTIENFEQNAGMRMITNRSAGNGGFGQQIALAIRGADGHVSIGNNIAAPDGALNVGGDVDSVFFNNLGIGAMPDAAIMLDVHRVAGSIGNPRAQV